MCTKRPIFILMIVLLFGFSVLNGCLSTQIEVASSAQAPTTISIVASPPLSPTSIQNLPTNWPTKVPPPAPSGLPPTWTALPTYPAAQARQMVMELYENNPCKLPCWWGITPGKTDWREAWQYLERFATNEPPWDNLLLEAKEHPGYMFYQVLLDVPQTAEEASYYSSLNHLIFRISIDAFTVDSIDVNTGNVDAYTIPAILAVYGKPAEIYVNFGRSQVPQYSGVTLSLYYPQSGFISAHFTTVTDDEWAEQRFTTCFQKVTDLLLWAQDQQLDYSEALGLSASNMTTGKSSWRPIHEVSDYSVDTFYRTYNGIKGQPCIEFIPKDK